MKENKQTDLIRLKHILEAIDLIQINTLNIDNFENFHDNILLKTSTEKWLEEIGEASHHLSNKLKFENPQIEWDEIYSLRNRVSHAYWDVDYQIIWDIIKFDIPILKNEIVKLISIIE